MIIYFYNIMIYQCKKKDKDHVLPKEEKHPPSDKQGRYVNRDYPRRGAQNDVIVI